MCEWWIHTRRDKVGHCCYCHAIGLLNLSTFILSNASSLALTTKAITATGRFPRRSMNVERHFTRNFSNNDPVAYNRVGRAALIFSHARIDKALSLVFFGRVILHEWSYNEHVDNIARTLEPVRFS